MDKAILHLRLEGKIRKIFHREIDTEMSLNCAAMSTDIAPSILGWLLLSVIGVCAIPMFAFLIVSATLRMSAGRQRSAVDLQDEVKETYP